VLILKVIYLKYYRDVRGQAMVEFVVAAPDLVTLLFSIWYVSNLYILKVEHRVPLRPGFLDMSKVATKGINSYSYRKADHVN